MTTADMIHGEGLPGDFAQRAKVIAAMGAYKTTSASYKPPGQEQVDGALLDSPSKQYTLHAGEQISKYKEDFGLAAVSGGLTVYRTSLISMLAIVMAVVVLLGIVRHVFTASFFAPPEVTAAGAASEKAGVQGGCPQGRVFEERAKCETTQKSGAVK